MNVMKLFLLIPCFLLTNFIFGQKVGSSTIASGGTTTVINGKYFSHVIGQSSVIAGTVNNNGITMRQGFKQPNLLVRSIQQSGLKIQVAVENPISYTLFPNPFTDKLKIHFSAFSLSQTYVAVYHISGQVIWERSYPEKINEINLSDFENVRVGKYLLHVLYQGKPFVASIIKE